MCVVCPSRTSERGGEGYCVKRRKDRKRERAVKVRQRHFVVVVVYYCSTALPNTKLCAWGEEDSGGHVLY